ncbi:hypothetical protein [Lacrimispora sp. 210928-DFI.3.58]|uniref:hypothetical protein n=1 Tax=Lacrimispora sp. 210928-DFI.3.58 TaxID=2883214 RepID=UPI001D095499|nr:hypothetical protein [Lacrimispora sp. 210928-DFI.3.58]MCB7321213.1 hypothetical protein [Lacrimispora sp. 210928-DFI.3.58]
MTTMSIIQKCRERFNEIPELQDKLSQTEESARVNCFRLENLRKEQALLSKILKVIDKNETELPRSIPVRPSNELKENRLKAYASVPDIAEVCTGKHDLTVVTEYMAGKSVADISKTIGLSSARILDILDNIKRRCLWYGKHNK